MNAKDSFHINHFGSTEPWPNGGWSVYCITGDQIAERIIRKEGKVVERSSWCGYVGIGETLADAMELIHRHRAEQPIIGNLPGPGRVGRDMEA